MPYSTSFCLVVALLVFGCGEFVLTQPIHVVSDPHWKPATATWYGEPDGDGSDGGACGYGSMVDVKPFRARVGAVSPILFKNGEGCGACYKVKCLDNEICSRRAVTVIITDECPGGYCSGGNTHFDLSGSAFGRMAVSGEGGQLRNRGVLNVIYRRTACKYPKKKIAFHVNEGSTNYWLSLLVEFEDGDGDVGSMHIRPSQCNESYPIFSTQIPSLNSNALGSSFEEENLEEEDLEAGNETPTSGRNQNAFEFKEDEALISSFMRISSDSCIGTNQKMSSFWSKVKALYDEARDANGMQMKVGRTQSMLVGRWGRITKAVMKFVGCIEAAKRDLGNRTSGMNDDDIIQRARGLYRGKFTFEAQWKMLRKFPKWQEVVTEFNSGDMRSTYPRQGRQRDQATPTTPSDDSGKRTRLNEAGGFSTPSDDGEGSRGRPMGRNEAKKKKGKGVVSSSVGIAEDLGDSISIYRDVQLKKLEASQLKEARKQSQLDLEMRRLEVEEKEAKFQKKWNMYESLMRRPNLTQQQQELADRLFNEIQDHLD